MLIKNSQNKKYINSCNLETKYIRQIHFIYNFKKKDLLICSGFNQPKIFSFLQKKKNLVQNELVSRRKQMNKKYKFVNMNHKTLNAFIQSFKNMYVSIPE